ncbi:hypothetical protein BGZ99_009041 [Dissophora globulifera]|uniref:BTB domain-containing protein n=1 Tax=Dissophora globulifera TaxID=979702 RepID=A0A9P6R5I6_9FUNG|nr:hypothetical protein BGZ99_009041 [Dissophora globulifera]
MSACIPAEESAPVPGKGNPITTANTSTDKSTPTSNDVLIFLTQAKNKTTESNLKYRAIIWTKGSTFAVYCSSVQAGLARIDLGPVGPKTYDRFDFVNILNINNKVLTLNKIREMSWKGLSIFVEEKLITVGEIFKFKVVFRSNSPNPPLTPDSIYPVPLGFFIATMLLPPKSWDKKAQASSPQVASSSCTTSLTETAPGSAPVPASAPAPKPTSAAGGGTSSGSSTSQADPIKSELKQDSTEPSPGLYKVLGFVSLATFMDSAHQQFQTIELGPPHSISSEETNNNESGYDVQFYHYDPASKTNNVIGAHRSVLSAYSLLSQFVDRTEALTRQVANEMHLTFLRPFPSVSQEQQLRQPELLQKRPIIVNVSDFPFPTFRALVSYVYTKDIKSILLHISALELTRALTALQDVEKEETVTNAAVGSSLIETKASTSTMATSTSTTLFIDELLLLTHMFEVRELFEMCVELTKMAITVENVVQVLMHLGTQFKEIKPHAMAFIKEHFHEIFGGLQGDPFKQLMSQEGGFQLMAEIMQMMATTKALETETNR